MTGICKKNLFSYRHQHQHELTLQQKWFTFTSIIPERSFSISISQLTMEEEVDKLQYFCDNCRARVYCYSSEEEIS